ncbi:hypothetical protein TNCV_3043431 [Trichonephila clavipes]|nr:hypothetical protein TNCV_3043431 [Trichonephila clavipes]
MRMSYSNVLATGGLLKSQPSDKRSLSVTVLAEEENSPEGSIRARINALIVVHTLVVLPGWLILHQSELSSGPISVEARPCLMRMMKVPKCAGADDIEVEQRFQIENKQDIMSDAEIIVAVRVNEKMPEKDEDINVEDTTQFLLKYHTVRD